MMPTSLYEISSAINDILGTEEWDDAAIERLEELNLALESKAKGITHFITNLTAFVDSAKEEEQRIALRRKAAENRISALKTYLLSAMTSAGRTEIEAGTFKIVIKNNPPSVCVDDESLLPARFFVTIPESYQLDKKSLAAELKVNDIPGAHLERGKSLGIK